LFQEFYNAGLGGHLTDTIFKVFVTSPTNAPTIYGTVRCFKFSNFTGICDGETLFDVASSSNQYISGVDFAIGATTTLDFFFDYTFDPSAYYLIGMNTLTGITYGGRAVGSANDVFADGECVPPINCGAVQDLYFQVIVETVTTGVTAIIKPEQGTTTPSTTVDVKINYYNSGNADTLTLLLRDRVTNENIELPVFDFPINTGFDTFLTTLTLAQGSYTLQAGLVNDTTGVSYGTLRNADFNVIQNSVVDVFGVDIYDSDSLLGLSTTTCSILNITGCFQNALVFAFVPSQNVFNGFLTLKDEIQNKPPFGYIALLITAFNDVSSETSPAFTLASEDNITDSIFTPIKTGLAWILWFAFGIWLYKRVRSIDI